MSLKVQDIRSLSEGELRDKLGEQRKELFSLRFKHATSQLETSHRIREVRKDIARLLTILQERFGA